MLRTEEVCLKLRKYERECLEYAFGSANIFRRVLQKSVSIFVWGGGVEVSLRTACCCQKQVYLKNCLELPG